MTISTAAPEQDATPLLLRVVGVRGRVDRRLYAGVGFSLMAFKYLAEMVLLYRFTGLFFDPLAFLIPAYFLRSEFLDAAPTWISVAIAVWSLPMMWIACTMSVRRAIDAGESGWLGLLIFVPLINLFCMLYLAGVPSSYSGEQTDSLNPDDSSIRESARRAEQANRSIYSAVAGLAMGGLFALAVTLISTWGFHDYGNSLFFGMPVVSGAVAAFLFNQPSVQTAGASFAVGMLAVCLGGLCLLLFAVEGVICLLMAAPLIVPLGGLGGLLGWVLASGVRWQSRWMLGGAMIMLPLISVVDSRLDAGRIRMVESSILINASPDRVWETVVTFPEIKSPPAWYFQAGIATPVKARIEGSGVGAVRYCEFTTGSFVEPITDWDRPRHLGFDVVDQPDPLTELTPYRNIRPPHLAHAFRSVRGEFRLIEVRPGQTQLVGRTWYILDMQPVSYWKPWTDEIIHRIHLRVLDHIRSHAEGS